MTMKKIMYFMACFMEDKFNDNVTKEEEIEIMSNLVSYILPALEGIKTEITQIRNKLIERKRFNECIKMITFNDVTNKNKVCKRFNFIITQMKKFNLISEGQCVLPSFFHKLDKNDKIKPFWNDKIQVLSNKMFMPISANMEKTINVGEKSGLLIEEQKSRQTNNYQLITRKNDKDVIKIVKCDKIKLYFDKEQKKIMNTIIGVYRYFYNRTVTYFNNIDKSNNTSWFCLDPKDINTKITIKTDNNLYNVLAMKQLLKKDLPKWLLQEPDDPDVPDKKPLNYLANYPVHLIDQAIMECFINMKACFERKKKTGKMFTLSFKSKKELVQTIKLEDRMIKSNGLFRNWKINNEYLFRDIRTSSGIKEEHNGSTLSYHTVLNEYYLNLTYNVDSNPTNINVVGAVDPGVRSPLTIYSQDKVVTIGTEMNTKIFKVCKEIDIIQSKLPQKDPKTKKYTIVKLSLSKQKHLRKALHRKIKHLKNIRSEFHNQTINYLCNNYGTIIFPPFKIQGMVGQLHSSVARKMYGLSLFQLKLKLQSKCKERHIRLLDLAEPYTSVTCTCCGKINKHLGKSKVFNCPSCHLIIDRDINGARNILLKNVPLI